MRALYQGVSLVRGLTLGAVGPGLLWPAAYLALMGLTGLYVAGRRISRCCSASAERELRLACGEGLVTFSLIVITIGH